jgi:hypothetical protein
MILSIESEGVASHEAASRMIAPNADVPPSSRIVTVRSNFEAATYIRTDDLRANKSGLFDQDAHSCSRLRGFARYTGDLSRTYR